MKTTQEYVKMSEACLQASLESLEKANTVRSYQAKNLLLRGAEVTSAHAAVCASLADIALRAERVP